MTHLKRLLREPLLHFLVLSGVIFPLFAAVEDGRKSPADVIVISPQRIDQLTGEFSAVWKRKIDQLLRWTWAADQAETAAV